MSQPAWIDPHHQSSRPRVTVVIPLYNAAQYVQAAVDSILNQTFRDFELLIVNDAATDSSREIVGTYSDPRVRIIDHDKNLGLVATLNEAFAQAAGDYIARMDHDDLARPERLQKQVEFLDANPEVALVGSWFSYIDRGITIESPVDHASIRYYSLFNNPFGHPTVMIRRKALCELGGLYDQDFYYAEDYELWTRIIDRHRTANIPVPLLDYRIHPTQMSASTERQRKVSDRVRLNQFRKTVRVSSRLEYPFFFRLIDQRPAEGWWKLIYRLWLLSLVPRALAARYLEPRFVKQLFLMGWRA